MFLVKTYSKLFSWVGLKIFTGRSILKVLIRNCFIHHCEEQHSPRDKSIVCIASLEPFAERPLNRMVEHINGVHVWCTYRCERHGIRSKVNWNDSEIRFRLSAPLPWVHSMSALTDEFGKSQTKWPVWIAYVHGKRVVNRSECLIDAFALTSHSNLFMSANEVRWTCHFMILVFCIVRYALVVTLLQWRYCMLGTAWALGWTESGWCRRILIRSEFELSMDLREIIPSHLFGLLNLIIRIPKAVHHQISNRLFDQQRRFNARNSGS